MMGILPQFCDCEDPVYLDVSGSALLSWFRIKYTCKLSNKDIVLQNISRILGLPNGAWFGGCQFQDLDTD